MKLEKLELILVKLLRDLARDSGQRQLTASNPNPCASSRSVYQMGDWTPTDTNLLLATYTSLRGGSLLPSDE